MTLLVILDTHPSSMQMPLSCWVTPLKTTLLVILTPSFFYGNAWYRAGGDALDAKTTLLVILNAHPSSIEMPGIVLMTPLMQDDFACNS